MSGNEAGIIGGPGGADPGAPPEQPSPPLPPEPTRPALLVPALEEGAWLLGAIALTAFVSMALTALKGKFAAAAPPVALFGLHGLVGLHVLRAERGKLPTWLRRGWRIVLAGLAGGALLLAFNGAYSWSIERIGVTPTDVISELTSLAPMPVIVAWAGFFAPIVEELYFRGRLLDALDARIGERWSTAVTAVLFGADHGIPEYFPAFVVLGLGLVWLRRRTGGLVAPIVAHILNNLVALS